VGQHRAAVALPEQRPDLGVITRHDETILSASPPAASPATAIDAAAFARQCAPRVDSRARRASPLEVQTA
jgi:hypothetical protein